MMRPVAELETKCPDDRVPRPLRPWFIVGLLLLLGLLILAHGCHGDEDHELFSGAGSRRTFHGLATACVVPNIGTPL